MQIPNCPAHKFLEAGQFVIDMCFLGRMLVCVVVVVVCEEMISNLFFLAARV
jgi:hypothetical protein